LATAGFDREINVWETFHEETRNLTKLVGHNNAILQLAWSQDDSRIYSCSADKTVCIWDLYEATRIKKLKGHEGLVNSIDASKKGPELVSLID
jgi:Prp8 binding protein